MKTCWPHGPLCLKKKKNWTPQCVQQSGTRQRFLSNNIPRNAPKYRPTWPKYAPVRKQEALGRILCWKPQHSCCSTMLVFAPVPPDLHSLLSSQSPALFRHPANTGRGGNVTEGGGAGWVTVSDAPSTRASPVGQRSCVRNKRLTPEPARSRERLRGFLRIKIERWVFGNFVLGAV